MFLLAFILIFPVLLLIDFLRFVYVGKRFFGNSSWRIDLSIMLILYFFFIIHFGLFTDLNCCIFPGAVYSPDHRLTLHFWIILSLALLAYSNVRNYLLPPLAEILMNGVFIMAIILNVLTWIHVGFLGSIGHLMAIIIFFLCLMKNYNLIHKSVKGNIAFQGMGLSKHELRDIPFFLFSFLMILPLNIFSTLILFLFGQRPNSLIKSFTETYHYRFSELTHLCENVDCGGHYLCSVAANGHRQIVKPLRLGIRNQSLIICNRQLLIANAFEDLIENKFPIIHRIVRRNYDRVGDFVHNHYYLFKVKWVSNLTYYLMKPLEWFFLICLYLFDKNPEDRIAIQYLQNKDLIRKILHNNQTSISIESQKAKSNT